MPDLRKTMKVVDGKLECPKCKQTNDANAEYCWACYMDFVTEDKQPPTTEKSDITGMPDFHPGEAIFKANKVTLKQKNLDISTQGGRYHFRDSYELSALDVSGKTIGNYEATEKGDAVMRTYTNIGSKAKSDKHRAYVVSFTETNFEFMSVTRDYTMFFTKASVYDRKRKIAMINRKFSLLTKKYEIFDGVGVPLGIMESSLFFVPTFTFTDIRGAKIATFTKKLVSIKDKYTIEFSSTSNNPLLRQAVLAAAIVIDYDYF